MSWPLRCTFPRESPCEGQTNSFCTAMLTHPYTTQGVAKLHGFLGHAPLDMNNVISWVGCVGIRICLDMLPTISIPQYEHCRDYPTILFRRGNTFDFALFAHFLWYIGLFVCVRMRGSAGLTPQHSNHWNWTWNASFDMVSTLVWRYLKLVGGIPTPPNNICHLGWLFPIYGKRKFMFQMCSFCLW
jgi:hypothetical protein